MNSTSKKAYKNKAHFILKGKIEYIYCIHIVRLVQYVHVCLADACEARETVAGPLVMKWTDLWCGNLQ